MIKIEHRIDNYFNEEFGIDYVEDGDILEKMYDLIISLDPDKLSDENADNLVGIIDDLADRPAEEDEEEMEEAIAAKRVRISPAAKRKRKKEYRKKRAKIRVKAKRYRKTAGYKKYQRKSKRLKKAGKTSTGKRIRKFI